MADAAAKTALFAALADDARAIYWDALSRFLTLQIDKPEFDKLALASLPVEAIPLHNGLILALLRTALEAQSGAPEAEEEEVGAQPSAPAEERKPLVSGSGSIRRDDTGKESFSAAGDGQAHESGAAPGAGLGAEPPPVDLAEADQLNALHDRLLGLCCRHGVPRVQLEAVSFVQRAVKAHMRRLLVASAEFAPAAGEGGATRRTVGTRELNAALTQPTSSAWLPPNQRLASATRSAALGGRLL
ncbi:hypothetical protein EMIHUDRAFT_450374 [Emiliania huxleyi CCMP1516]|uniref:Uncharacterized protein n=2 Tax=Emiliania huxleyi TaxID=2903 RepID=A0A0D3JQI7_EMIH1|nr:hypothetical protein EMIHUDRAFT_460172 [Emiliania huxleyi CCMP1516]XP_005778201.1 hypothetical protein EMIHUDRAFT_450374 [Emiliania huxleyi CCMP1516]EOD05850.1 hypothetical protein EMIHUDRAFT_460172 [Emiliania huxleyi CCMP1516]EOD25772.1 hypothetical protein EMIHUDRAFT_450374 [Emiliania huxleyi CCMP1516]|eukprot:XP_005758279.1 hypothetical protein EMIHUDRAFT_460172 [Emiliania huxleyi CCMP1516]